MHSNWVGKDVGGGEQHLDDYDHHHHNHDHDDHDHDDDDHHDDHNELSVKMS